MAASVEAAKSGTTDGKAGKGCIFLGEKGIKGRIILSFMDGAVEMMKVKGKLWSPTAIMIVIFVVPISLVLLSGCNLYNRIPPEPKCNIESYKKKIVQSEREIQLWKSEIEKWLRQKFNKPLPWTAIKKVGHPLAHTKREKPYLTWHYYIAQKYNNHLSSAQRGLEIWRRDYAECAQTNLQHSRS